jgi:hypothetical protein
MEHEDQIHSPLGTMVPGVLSKRFEDFCVSTLHEVGIRFHVRPF